MDNPQYIAGVIAYRAMTICFKPYYKWITLNTEDLYNITLDSMEVLNLIING